MDIKEAKTIIMMTAVARLLRYDPKEAIKQIKENRNLFNVSDEFLEQIEKEAEKSISK